MSSITSKIPVVPDQVLETHICRLCQKYLTVSPITVHPDGGNVCGRCHRKVSKNSYSLFECYLTSDITEQINIPYAIFGYVNHLFPCINRYEGCSKLLAFNDISTHEITCRSRTAKCPYCGYEGTGSQQINHFKTVHPMNFFEKINFRFPFTHSCSNLIKRGEDLFFVNMDYDDEQKLVTFYVEPTKCLDEDVDFFCLLKEIDGEVIDQKTSTRRGKNAIYHRIYIRDKYALNEDLLYCDCLLRRVQQRHKKIFC